LDEGKSQDDIVLDRQNVFAIDDIEVGTDGGTEGGVGAVSYKDLFGVAFEDQLSERFRFTDTCHSERRMAHCRVAGTERSKFPGASMAITGGKNKLPGYKRKPMRLRRRSLEDSLTSGAA
jgi:hypothetical protein